MGRESHQLDGGQYRPDVDGLRACAVVAVVLYHVGVPGISGGFIGVDVFFVISGFLITSQLISESHSTSYSLIVDFYARRARRILPSLALVTSATLILGWVFLLPDGEQQNLAKSAIASALFVSNIFFWQVNNDYFADRAELQPLLHTWSLSVEEQYYLVWPALLLILWAVERYCRLRANCLVAGAVLIFSISSFVLSIHWAGASPLSAFFLTPSRVWELGTGAALSLIISKNNRAALSESFRLIGLSLILIAATVYTARTPFPGTGKMAASLRAPPL
jgi:peptidoglycan/LPS O-acetylase OafA/YrhL